MQEEAVQQKPWAFEVDIKKPDPLSPQKSEAMRQKLEEQARKHHPMSDKLSDSVLRMVIQMKQLSAERKREFYLNLIKEKAGEDVRHAREVAKKMKESLVADIKRAKEVLNKQQQLAATVRENILLERKQKSHSNVVHSKEVYEKQLEELEERKKRLAKTIELEQEAAELHRDAIRTYTTLECHLHNDHVNQIVQDHKKDQEFVKTVLETTSKYHEALAQRLHDQSLAMKQEKAHKEIEHAQEVSEKHKKELQEREEEEKEWESLTEEIQNANEEYAEFVTQTHKVVDELLNEHTKELLDFTYEPREEKLTNE